MQHREFEYIVIGAGGTGAATAYQLAKRGSSVALFERFQIGHDKGSSHGHSRIFRFAYDRPEYARMAVEALRAWRELEADAEEQLLTPTGGLDLGPEGTASLDQTTQSLSAVGADYDLLDAAQLMARFPQWRVPDDWMGVYSEDAGIVNSTESVDVLAAAAQAHGATLLEWTPVTRISTDGSIRLETPRGTFTCRKLIVAAGGWLNELMPDLNLQLTVTLEASVFFRPQRIEEFRVGRFPLFIEHSTMAYGFPVFGLPGVKVGLHHDGAPTTASSRDFAVSPETIDRVRAFLEARLPRAAGRVIQAKTCLYTNTPGTDFLIDTHANIAPGGSEDIIIASPCSGHGFKFVPLIGEVLADAAMGATHPFWLPRFRRDVAAAPV